MKATAAQHLSETRIVWPKVGTAELERFTPPPLGPTDVRIRTNLSLVSPGTERSWLSGLKRFPFPDAGFPFHPGYALVGIVEEVGHSVDAVAPDDTVFTGGPGYGCHSSVVVFDQAMVMRVPEDIAPDEAVAFPLADTAMGAVRRARIELGESVAVLGLGPVGQLAAQSARAAGGAPVIGFDPVPERRELATTVSGARAAFDPADAAAVERIADVEAGVDVVIEFAGGGDDALNLAMRLVGRFGRVIAASRTSSRSSLDLEGGLLMKGATFVHFHVTARPQLESRPGCWTVRDQWGAFVRLLRDGRLNTKSLIERVAEWEDLPRVYDELLAGTASPVGTLVRWHGPAPDRTELGSDAR